MDSFWHQLNSLLRELWSGELIARLYRRYFESEPRDPRLHDGFHFVGGRHIDCRCVSAGRLDMNAIEFPQLPDVDQPAFPDVSAHLDAGEDAITDMPDGATFRRGYGHLTREELEALLERMKKAERYEECQKIQNILDRRRDG